MIFPQPPGPLSLHKQTSKKKKHRIFVPFFKVASWSNFCLIQFVSVCFFCIQVSVISLTKDLWIYEWNVKWVIPLWFPMPMTWVDAQFGSIWRWVEVPEWWVDSCLKPKTTVARQLSSQVLASLLASISLYRSMARPNSWGYGRIVPRGPGGYLVLRVHPQV